MKLIQRHTTQSVKRSLNQVNNYMVALNLGLTAFSCRGHEQRVRTPAHFITSWAVRLTCHTTFDVPARCNACWLHFPQPDRTTYNPYGSAPRHSELHSNVLKFFKNTQPVTVILEIITVTANKRCAGIAQSIQRRATGWTVRGSNPNGGMIFRTRPDRSWGPPSLL
jgi:hypothetical protein